MSLYNLIKKRDSLNHYYDCLISLAVDGDRKAAKQAPKVLRELLKLTADIIYYDDSPKYSGGYQPKPRLNKNTKVSRPPSKK